MVEPGLVDGDSGLLEAPELDQGRIAAHRHRGTLCSFVGNVPLLDGVVGSSEAREDFGEEEVDEAVVIKVGGIFIGIFSW